MVTNSFTSEPSGAMVKRLPDLPSSWFRPDEKAMRDPSGDQTGSELPLSCFARVSLDDPSMPAIFISHRGKRLEENVYELRIRYS